MLADATGAECDRSGRIKVRPDCSLPGHPEVFVVGDMMNFSDLPGVSEVALQSGLHAAHVIRKRVENGSEPTAWRYRDLGSMAAVARRSAIMSAHGVRLSGWIAWLVWLAVHITFMTGFKNRFTALIHWLLCFVGSGRCERAIAVDLDRVIAHDLRRSGGLDGSDPQAHGPDAAKESAAPALS
jgi:NADH dehydrogenase